MGRLASIGRRFCVNREAAIAGKPAPTGVAADSILVVDTYPVGAGLPAMNDNAVCDQNSKVLDNETCRESPIDTKNRLAADV